MRSRPPALKLQLLLVALQPLLLQRSASSLYPTLSL